MIIWKKNSELISFKVDAEIINFNEGKSEKVFERNIIDKTQSIENSSGKISVSGKINVALGAKKGSNLLKLSIKDNFSGKEKQIEKYFRVEEWPENYEIQKFSLDQYGLQ